MKLYFYRGEAPNFGDELNHHLIPKVFPNFFDDSSDATLLAIGSILFDGHPAEPLKVVFGSGYGGYGKMPVIDEKWKIYCVRGPRTAEKLGLARSASAGDAAILINRYRTQNPVKKYRCSFMPHWQSLYRGDWEAVCRLAGVNFIDPRWPVQEVLDLIEASEMVVAEAMHGAIVADALRVPWVPVMPFDASHRFKWYDWAEALDIDLRPFKLAPSSVQEAWILATGRGGKGLAKANGPLKALVSVADKGFNRYAASSLRKLAGRTPTLSSDTAIARAVDHLESSAASIMRDFPR